MQLTGLWNSVSRNGNFCCIYPESIITFYSIASEILRCQWNFGSADCLDIYNNALKQSNKIAKVGPFASTDLLDLPCCFHGVAVQYVVRLAGITSLVNVSLLLLSLQLTYRIVTPGVSLLTFQPPPSIEGSLGSSLRSL